MKNICRTLMATFAIVSALAFTAVAKPAAAAPVFVGSFQVNGGRDYGDPGPYVWTNNPLCFTGQEAAALLFGGVSSDYFISIDPSLDPTTITHTAHLDGWAEVDTIFAEDYKLQTGTGYNDPGGQGSAWSAYVLDHHDGNVNYVWRNVVDQPVDPPCDTPEPTSLALLGTGLAPFLGILKRRFLG